MYFLILAVAIFHCSEAIEICEMPEDAGPCSERIPRFVYTNGECEQFNYEGCGGNQNNFLSLRGCVETCRVSPCQNCNDNQFCKIDLCIRPPCVIRAECLDRTTTCSLPKVTGPCRGSFANFFYNVQSGKCEAFTFGRCGGNNNRFETRGSCEEACEVGLCKKCNENQICKIDVVNCGSCPIEIHCLDRTNTCSLPKVTGPCKRSFPNFFYNVQSGNCEEFTYGGCGGNDNRFKTGESCKEACEGIRKTETSLSSAPCKMNSLSNQETI